MLGYSARAGSLEATDLRRYYRQIERYLYYYLPRDTPAEEKLRLSAATAPRRLFFIPSAAGLQIAGQVCYRATDTEGRPGSYFAHALFRQENSGPARWSALGCLRLWRAPGWVEEDSAGIPFRLPELDAPKDLMGARRPAIGDRVLQSFLTVAAGGEFDDPAQVIPPRWREKEAKQRAAIVIDAMDSFLDLDLRQRQSLLLVVEPEVAALVFYAVARLLPRGPIADAVSFCTFEPNPDRLCTVLAATTFFDPSISDLRPDAYRQPGTVINTYLNRRSERRRPPGRYAAEIVGALVQGGWPAVNRRLENLESLPIRENDELERLAVLERLRPALLSAGPLPLDPQWRGQPLAAEYLRKMAQSELGATADAESRLRPLLGTPAHLLVLELVGGEGETSPAATAVKFLLANLSDKQISAAVALKSLGLADKADLIVRYVTDRGDLPPDSDWIWQQASEARARGHMAETLLVAVLARLGISSLESLYQKVAGRRDDLFVFALRDACRKRKTNWAALSHILRTMDQQHLIGIYRQHKAAFFKDHPEDEPALGKQIQKILRTLPAYPREFSERLDFVLAAARCLPDDLDRENAAAWEKCRQAILEVGGLTKSGSGWMQRSSLGPLEDACHRLAQAAHRAMSPDVFQDDAAGHHKVECLRQLGRELLGGVPLLPQDRWQHIALWRKIDWCFSDGAWSPVPLGAMRQKKRRRKTQVKGSLFNLRRLRPWHFVVVGTVAGVLVGAGWLLWDSGVPATPPVTMQGNGAGKPPSVVIAPAKIQPAKQSAQPMPAVATTLATVARPPVPLPEPVLPPPAPKQPGPKEDKLEEPLRRDVVGRVEEENTPLAVSPKSVPADEDASAKTPSPLAPAARENAEQTPADTVSSEGHFSVKAEAGFQPYDNFIARLQLRLLDPTGNPLPPQPARDGHYVVRGVVIEKYGDKPGRKSLAQGRDSFEAVGISADADRVAVCLDFCRTTGILPDQEMPLLWRTTPFEIDAVESSHQYTVDFRLSDAQWKRLQSLEKEAAPSDL